MTTRARNEAVKTSTAALALVITSTSLAACTVFNDMSGYTGGLGDTAVEPVVDTGSNVDSFVPPIDTGTPKDTAVEDTTVVDTTVTDTGVDTGTITMDTAPPTDTAADTTVVDSPACGVAYKDFGVSEVMARGTSGTGDKREWIEITNYGAGNLDVSGVTVKVFSGTGLPEKGSLTIPSGTMLAAGASIVIAGERTTFVADVPTTYGLGTVFEFAKSDILVNSSATEIRLYGPSCTTPYETINIPTRTWSVGQPWAYPTPSSTCPASARLSGTAPGAAWKEVPTSTSPYGSYALSDAGTQNVYGTPTKANNVACP